MKYCVHYHRNSPFNYFDEIDEIEVRFRKEDTTVPEFLEKYADKTIIMSTDKVEDLEMLSLLYEKYKNFKVRVDYTNEELTDAILETNLPFFFSNFIDSWDRLVGIIELGPTDVYVVNELGFELDKVGKYAHKNNVQVRIFPNIAQSSWENTVDIKKFFVRPEDISICEQYVDVCEFQCNEPQLNTYYKIYAKDKQWFGDLQEIILNFNTELDSRRLVPLFGPMRLKCGKRCFRTGQCHICERAVNLTHTMIDKNIIFTDK